MFKQSADILPHVKNRKRGWARPLNAWKEPGSALAMVCFFLLVIFVARADAGPDQITNDFNMTFIRVNPGTFIMGSPPEEKYRDADETQHKVTITTAFYLQDSEVTQAQWQEVMGKRWFFQRKNHSSLPVTRVSWHECMKFINKLNAHNTLKYRLPTEAEWEYACRAGTSTAYSFGATIDCTMAMFANNREKDGTCISYYKSLNRNIAPEKPAPVKTFKPNAWGFYDMHGNVWEWCADIYGPYRAAPITDTFSITSSGSRVRRGGSFYKHASALRSANRTYGHPGSKFQTTGFRLVLKADE